MEDALNADAPTPLGEAVLLAGAFGVGKTSVCEEIAARLEAAGRAYGAIDLDWLRWFYVPGMDEHVTRQIHLDNVHALAGAYARAGATRLVLAGSVPSRDGVDDLRAVLPFNLRVVRLTVPLKVIEQRLATAPTEERRVSDARAAANWLHNGMGADVGDVVIDADRSVEAVTHDVLAWLGWR
jgi:gluconate kinase